jgi:nucleoside phosphorylase
MFEAALAEERHRRLKDALARDGLPVTRFRSDAPRLVVVFHALDLEAAAVQAAGWREIRCPAHELVPAEAPTLAWIRTGVGPAAARRVVAALPDVPIEAAICVGFAGALSRALSPRTVVVGDPLLDRSGGETPAPLADSLAMAARAAGLDCVRGGLVTVEEMAETSEEKARLREETNAIAVDMESAVLAAALAARGIPAASARVVLDTSEEEIPSSLGALWRRPSLLISGLRIAVRMRPCARISARMLEAWLRDRSEPT